LKLTARKILGGIKRRLFVDRSVHIQFDKKSGNSWLERKLTLQKFKPLKPLDLNTINQRLEETQNLGRQPLWKEYFDIKDYPRLDDLERSAKEVSTYGALGNFYTWLVTAKKPRTIVEFGTAFGVSGMYFLSGLKANDIGRLYTFEPNEIWAKMAQENLCAVDTRFTLTVGTFEDNMNSVLGKTKIDLAFIDAIHTSEFVVPQFNLVADKLSKGGLIILDDIDFSDDMRSCWQKIVSDDRVKAAVNLGRVGIVEL